MSSLVSGRSNIKTRDSQFKEKRFAISLPASVEHTHHGTGDMPGRKIPGTSKKGQCVSGKRTSLPILGPRLDAEKISNR
jgi:hypothetical protein